jgi:D-alanine-D-alanine ligase-like ATP-grasp enzyme
MAERKTRIAILFGGRSAEHDVSRASAANALRSLDPGRYDVTLMQDRNRQLDENLLQRTAGPYIGSGSE